MRLDAVLSEGSRGGNGTSLAEVDVTAERFLIARIGGTPCAVPLASVLETLRPLPVETLAGVPSFMAGLAIIRGVPVPVVSGNYLMGGPPNPIGRWLVLRAGSHRVALAVDDVAGILPLRAAEVNAMPPLMRQGSALVADIGTRDGELLLVLDATRILPDELFEVLEARRVA